MSTSKIKFKIKNKQKPITNHLSLCQHRIKQKKVKFPYKFKQTTTKQPTFKKKIIIIFPTHFDIQTYTQTNICKENEPK